MSNYNPFSSCKTIPEYTMMYRLLHGEREIRRQEIVNNKVLQFIFDNKYDQNSSQFTKQLQLSKVNPRNVSRVTIVLGNFSDKDRDCEDRLLKLGTELHNVVNVDIIGVGVEDTLLKMYGSTMQLDFKVEKYNPKFFKINYRIFHNFLKAIPRKFNLSFDFLPLDFLVFDEKISLNSLSIGSSFSVIDLKVDAEDIERNAKDYLFGSSSTPVKKLHYGNVVTIPGKAKIANIYTKDDKIAFLG